MRQSINRGSGQPVLMSQPKKGGCMKNQYEEKVKAIKRLCAKIVKKSEQFADKATSMYFEDLAKVEADLKDVSVFLGND